MDIFLIGSAVLAGSKIRAKIQVSALRESWTKQETIKKFALYHSTLILGILLILVLMTTLMGSTPKEAQPAWASFFLLVLYSLYIVVSTYQTLGEIECAMIERGINWDSIYGAAHGT